MRTGVPNACAVSVPGVGDVLVCGTKKNGLAWRPGPTCERHDRWPELTPRSEWQRDFEDPATDLERDTVLVEDDAGPVGFGFCYVPSEPPRDLLFAFVWTFVVPEARQEVGDQLLARTADIGTVRLASVTTDARKLVRGTAMEHQVEDLARFERLGFEPIRWFVVMSRSLAEPLPERADHVGEVLLRPFHDDDVEPTRAVHNAAFADHWGGIVRSAHEWRTSSVSSAHFRSDLSSVATDGDEPVGYLLSHHYPEDREMTGRHELWVSLLGVLPSHRGRGLTSALLRRLLHQARAAGFESVGLDVDGESPTGAVRLYERLGFRPLERSISYGRGVG